MAYNEIVRRGNAGAKIHERDLTVIRDRRTFLEKALKSLKVPADAAVSFARPTPILKGIEERTAEKDPFLEPVISFEAAKKFDAKKDKHFEDSVLKRSSNTAFRGRLEQEMDILNAYWGWRGILQPEYDLLEGYTLLDVESYYKRAIDRMVSLAFRSGVHVVGDNDQYVQYLNDRIAQVGYIMGTGFVQFLKKIITNLWICSNVIVSKIRDTNSSGGTRSERNGNMIPVAGYAIIPPHTIFPYLDGHGHIEKWRRFFKDGRPFRDYLPEDIIHFKWDVKPGHIFGTPRNTAVRDDVFALRRLEENVELLLVNHLFPLFHVKVGNEKAPVEYLPDGTSEIDWIRNQIQSMPKEGVFVTDDRVGIDVEGAEGEGVSPEPTLQHFKNRVFTGLGVSSVDMGEGDTANRATAENVSQNLKDMIASDLQTFSDMVDMEMFREMFSESRVKMSVQKAVASTHLDFGEIDVDGEIKKETHALNLFSSHAIDHDEMRRKIRHNPLTADQKKKMHYQMHIVDLEKVKADNRIRIDNNAADHALKQAAVAASTKKTGVKKSNSKTGASTTKTTEEPTEHTKKALSNIVQPANQHGKNLDPHKARSSEDPSIFQVIEDEVGANMASGLYDKLLEARKSLLPEDGVIDINQWREVSSAIVDGMGFDLSDGASLKHAISLSSDEDLVWAAIRSCLGDIAPEEDEEEPAEESSAA